MRRDDDRMPRRPATLPRAAGSLLAALVMSVGMPLPVAAQASPEVPEPVLVVTGGAADGQVALSPATQVVTQPRVAWLLTNGGADDLVFQLGVHDVVTSDGNVEVGAERPDLALALEQVQLGSGEAARIPLHLPDATTPGTIALVARTVEADPETTVSGVALLGADGEVAPAIASADAGAGTFTVRLDADTPTIVDVAVRSSVWPGTMQADDLVEDVLVPAGGRDLDIDLDGAVAGRLHIDVAVSDGGRASAAVWWWPAEVVLAALALVALVAALAVWLVRRRRPRSSDA